MSNAFILQHNRITQKPSYSARTQHYEHYPLIRGNVVPLFTLPGTDLSLNDLLRHTEKVVLFFHTPGTSLLEPAYLQLLQQAVQEAGAQLVVITGLPAASVAHIKRTHPTLPLYHDINNAIAHSFGLYNAENPLWHWVPGIEDSNAFLPALYVFGADRTIEYHFIDYHFSLLTKPALLQQVLPQALASETYKPYYTHALSVVQ